MAITRLSVPVLSLLACLFLSSCLPPPPPSPRWVAREIYRYQYFPSAHVYYNPGRRLYFYLDHDEWVSAPVLPPRIRINLNNHVDIDIHGPRPYLGYRDHRRRYPPGYFKEKHREKRELHREHRELKRERRELHRDRAEEGRERKREDRRDLRKHRRERHEDARSDRRRDRDEDRREMKKDRRDRRHSRDYDDDDRGKGRGRGLKNHHRSGGGWADDEHGRRGRGSKKGGRW